METDNAERKLEVRVLWRKATALAIPVAGVIAWIAARQFWIGAAVGVLTLPWLFLTTRWMFRVRDTHHHSDYFEATLYGWLLGVVTEGFVIALVARLFS